jgi:hypothetical protein
MEGGLSHVFDSKKRLQADAEELFAWINFYVTI